MTTDTQNPKPIENFRKTKESLRTRHKLRDPGPKLRDPGPILDAPPKGHDLGALHGPYRTGRFTARCKKEQVRQESSFRPSWAKYVARHGGRLGNNPKRLAALGFVRPGPKSGGRLRSRLGNHPKRIPATGFRPSGAESRGRLGSRVGDHPKRIPATGFRPTGARSGGRLGTFKLGPEAASGQEPNAQRPTTSLTPARKTKCMVQ